jgi:hypothetical protein
LQPWQMVTGFTEEILLEQISRLNTVEDLPLDTCQGATLANIDTQTSIVRGQGFSYMGHWFLMVGSVPEARLDMIARMAWPAAGVDVPDTFAQLYHLATDADRGYFLAARDSRDLAIFTAHDSHVSAVLATTTPEAAMTYDYLAGWPDPPPGGEEIP